MVVLCFVCFNLKCPSPVLDLSGGAEHAAFPAQSRGGSEGASFRGENRDHQGSARGSGGKGLMDSSARKDNHCLTERFKENTHKRLVWATTVTFVGLLPFIELHLL